MYILYYSHKLNLLDYKWIIDNEIYDTQVKYFPIHYLLLACNCFKTKTKTKNIFCGGIFNEKI